MLVRFKRRLGLGLHSTIWYGRQRRGETTCALAKGNAITIAVKNP